MSDYLEVTLRIKYKLEDNLVERQNGYGSIDPVECAAVDQENNPISLIEALIADFAFYGPGSIMQKFDGKDCGTEITEYKVRALHNGR